MACTHDCKNCSENCGSRDLSEKPNKYSSIKKVIGIVSGKGGVGKSLVTSLLAVKLKQKGYNSAILDADITGPSIPKMFGVKDKATGNELGLFPNNTSSGIKIMSSNLLLKNDTDPVVWRGAIISGLVKQFWHDVIWQDIDFLLVDMPPGTGDVPLTVFQSFSVDGIIIVTSPQELVSMIVTKAVNMANMMNIPILGLVENMSYIECPNCNEHISIFGESHVEEIAKSFNLDVLAKMPLNPNIASLCDKGEIEKVDVDYLDEAVQKLEDLPLEVTTISVFTKDKEISNLDDAKDFYIYQIVKGMIIKGTSYDISNLNLTERLEYLHNNYVEIAIGKEESIEVQKHLKSIEVEYLVNKGDPLNAVQDFLGLNEEESK